MTRKARDRSDVAVVITAPARYAAAMALRARARLTLGTLTQLIANSQQYVILSVPYIQENDSVGTPVYLALQSALRRGVDVDIVSTLAGLQAVAEKRFRRGAKGVFRFYRPLANLQDERRLGSHAKFCVCDGIGAYVGSANLTMPGLSENLEIGVLLRGEPAQQIENFWRLAFGKGSWWKRNSSVFFSIAAKRTIS